MARIEEVVEEDVHPWWAGESRIPPEEYCRVGVCGAKLLHYENPRRTLCPRAEKHGIMFGTR